MKCAPLALALLLAAHGQAPDTVPPQPKIEGARLTLVRKTIDVMSVTLENHRDSPMVSWQVKVKSGRAGHGAINYGSDFSRRPIDATPGHGAIKPHEKRVIEIDLRDVPDAEPATLQVGAFDDGYYEGVAGALEAWRTARRDLTDDLGYWARALFEMPRISEPDVRQFLAARTAERSVAHATDPSGIRAKLLRALQQFPPGTDPWPALDRIRAEAQSEYAASSRRPPEDTPADAVGAITAVAISSHRSTSPTFAASIENLRDVPIEAYEIEILEPGSDRRASTHGMDYCVAESDTQPGHGRVKPHETREESLGVPVNNDAPRPQVRLSYVLFDDLTFEGAPERRDELFKSREIQAKDYAFMIEVLGQAAALPATEARALIVARRAERARQIEAEGRGGASSVIALDDLIRQSTTSSEAIPAAAKRMQQVLERQRQRLLRHTVK